VYRVEAEDANEAQKAWTNGHPVLSEVDDAEVSEVIEVED